MGNKHRRNASLVISMIQIKTIMIYHLIPITLVKLKYVVVSSMSKLMFSRNGILVHPG